MKSLPKCAVCLLLASVSSSLAPSPVIAVAQPAGSVTQVDEQARAIAESVLEAMGGRQAWDNTRYISWRFFGFRHHVWDKWTGNLRIQTEESDRGPATLVLMNLNTRQGRVWSGGEELSGERLTEALEGGWRMWVNDSYWMFMPYKLLDPGVSLKYVGEGSMADDREAEVLELTFEGVGVTPQNKYLVYVAADTGLVEQWSYFADRDDAEPGFTRPWGDWQQFGRIMLATSKGRDANWAIQVYDELPADVFSDPDGGLQQPQ